MVFSVADDVVGWLLSCCVRIQGVVVSIPSFLAQIQARRDEDGDSNPSAC
mgnify:CR=1 FL=1